jgi:general L-amino acid transport system permease protein
MTTVYREKETLAPPPAERRNIIGWMLKNLFNTWYNTILTLISGYIVFVLVRGLAHWVVEQARWEVIPANYRLFLLGQYPSMIPGETDYAWRVWLALYLLMAVGGLMLGIHVSRRDAATWTLLFFPPLVGTSPYITNIGLRIVGWILGQQDVYQFPGFSLKAWGLMWGMTLTGLVFWYLGQTFPDRLRRSAAIAALLYFPVAIFIIAGFGEGGLFRFIPTRFWGGLLLSLILTVVGIVFSFPLGVLLALGRQSKLPVLKTLSVIYIEFIRGVPLISLLFMAQIMLPLFLPANVVIDRVIRAMVAITLFAAAYLAENVRGGLQAIPKGQYEAAWAIGLSGFQTMVFIILPQALRLVIPVLVNQFIGLFKDTTLVAIVGLLDLLGIAQGVIANPKFIGTQREVFTFISVFYFVFTYAMSYASRRLEKALGVGER